VGNAPFHASVQFRIKLIPRAAISDCCSGGGGSVFSGPSAANHIFSINQIRLVRSELIRAPFLSENRWFDDAFHRPERQPSVKPSAESSVERWRGVLGEAYPLAALSSAGASLASPYSVSTSRSSIRACGFLAHGSPTGFSRQHTMARSRIGRDSEKRRHLR
jgi:hypothetical protein